MLNQRRALRCWQMVPVLSTKRSTTLINNIFPEQVLRWGDLGRSLTHDLGPAGRAPRLALVANLHGDDLNGLFVLSRLTAFLRNVAAGRRRGLQLRERVVIVPGVEEANAGAGRWNARWARGRRPGSSRVLESVMAMTRMAYYRVEVRAAGCELEELPQVWLSAPSDDERASACLFGLPAVVEQAADENARALAQGWRGESGENFVICAGQAGALQTRHCETLFRALAAFLERTGVIGGLRLVEDEEDVHYFDRRQACDVRAKPSGMFHSTLEVGCWVAAGEELGWIYDSFTGQTRSPVLAPVAGLLAGLRRQPLLCEGNLVARILVSTSVG